MKEPSTYQKTMNIKKSTITRHLKNFFFLFVVSIYNTSYACDSLPHKNPPRTQTFSFTFGLFSFIAAHYPSRWKYFYIKKIICCTIINFTNSIILYFQVDGHTVNAISHGLLSIHLGTKNFPLKILRFVV